MSGPAKVYSSDAIEAVRIALLKFIDYVGDALSELSGEMRRTQEWLEHDRPRYWRNQTRLAMDQVHEAQQALHRCLMFPVADERPSCTEERMALKKARAKLEYCEKKSERVRHWQQMLRHEMFEYEGRISQLVKLAEIDAPRAVAVLNKILRQLEAYHAVRAADPRSSYDDVAVAKAIWDEEKKELEEAAEAGSGPPAEAAPPTASDVPAQETTADSTDLPGRTENKRHA